MKKCLILLIMLMLFVVSCGGGDDSDSENDDSDVESGIVFPWTDPDTGLIWSEKISQAVRYSDAKSFCYRMKESDEQEWRVPTIEELITLIKNCPKTETGGSCKVKDSCSSTSCINSACSGCENSSDGRYSKLGDAGWYWSSTSSGREYGGYFFVGYSAGYVNETHDADWLLVRCVR